MIGCAGPMVDDVVKMTVEMEVVVWDLFVDGFVRPFKLLHDK